MLMSVKMTFELHSQKLLLYQELLKDNTLNGISERKRMFNHYII